MRGENAQDRERREHTSSTLRNRSFQPIINSELIYWTELSDLSILSPRHSPGPRAASARQAWLLQGRLKGGKGCPG